jgi:hypothetical protein
VETNFRAFWESLDGLSQERYRLNGFGGLFCSGLGWDGYSSLCLGFRLNGDLLGSLGESWFLGSASGREKGEGEERVGGLHGLWVLPVSFRIQGSSSPPIFFFVMEVSGL